MRCSTTLLTVEEQQETLCLGLQGLVLFRLGHVGTPRAL